MADKLVSQTEFAKIINCTRQYVYKLKSAGRLKLDRAGKKIYVNASINLIKDTADPSSNINDHITDRIKSKKNTYDHNDETINVDDEDTNEENTSINSSYQNSRKLREAYTARLKKIEYLKEIGELVHRDGIEKASFKIGRILQNKLAALPSRLAPRVTIESDQKNNFQIIQEEIESIINDILSELQKEQLQK